MVFWAQRANYLQQRNMGVTGVIIQVTMDSFCLPGTEAGAWNTNHCKLLLMPLVQNYSLELRVFFFKRKAVPKLTVSS